MLHGRKGVEWIWEPSPEMYLRSPKTLVELALKVIDSQPLPECVSWPTSRVLEWIEYTVELPQYKVSNDREYAV